MQAAIVLAAESRAAIYHLPLPAWPDLRRHLGADRAAVAARADELELDPALTPRPPLPSGEGERVAIEQRPALLIRHHHVEQTIVEEIGHGDRPAIQQVGDTGFLCDIHKSRLAAIQQHARALEARQ